MPQAAHPGKPQVAALCGGAPPGRRAREHNYHAVTELVAELVEKTKGRISAKWLLPAARAAGHAGTARSLRRLVAERKALWRNDHHCGRRPAVWSPVGIWSSMGVLGRTARVLRGPGVVPGPVRALRS